MMAIRFLVNGFGSMAEPPSVAFFMLASSAEAKTSPGAPLLAWPASVDEESKENLTWTSELAAWKACPISLKASVNDAAARTVMSPASFFAVVVVVGAAVAVVELD